MDNTTSTEQKKSCELEFDNFIFGQEILAKL